MSISILNVSYIYFFLDFLSFLSVLKNDNTSQSTANASSVKALGAFLIIAGIGADVISMFMISGSSFESFGAITIFGTIAFLAGLALFSNG